MPHQGVPSPTVMVTITEKHITPPSSLIRTHGLEHNPPFGFTLRYCERSLQVVGSPCWKVALPSVISAGPPLGAWTHTPAAPMVHIPICSGPQVCSLLRSPPQCLNKAAVAFSSGHNTPCYQRGTLDMLAVGTGKSMAGEFNPIGSAALLGKSRNMSSLLLRPITIRYH